MPDEAKKLTKEEEEARRRLQAKLREALYPDDYDLADDIMEALEEYHAREAKEHTA